MPPMSGYPGVGAQGPMQGEDPVSALARFLGVHPSTISNPASFGADDQGYSEGVDALRGGDPQQQVQAPAPPAAAPFAPSPAPASSGPSGSSSQFALPQYGNRNQALSEAIGKKYGVSDAANGSSSQQDLEAVDSFFRGHDVADKTAVLDATGRNQRETEAVKGDYGLAEGEQRGRFGLQQEDERGRYALEGDKIKADAQRDAALAKQPQMGPDGLPVNNKPLDAVESREARGLRQAMTLASTLQSVLDPSQDQVPDKLTTMAKWMAYKSGFSTDPKEQQRMNLAGLLKVVGSSPYVAGSRNFQYLQQVQDHLTDPTMTDKRLNDSIEELKAVWPEMLQNIITSHRTPGAALDQTPVTLPGHTQGGHGSDLGRNF